MNSNRPSNLWRLALLEELAQQQIRLLFNSASGPQFGGAWKEKWNPSKLHSKVILKEQTVRETVLCTVLTEVEGILNLKPLGPQMFQTQNR